MGILGFIFKLLSGTSTSSPRYGKNAKRTFAPFPKRKSPSSRRTTGNTSRYRRF
jgi:hypothetical protein